MYYCGMNGPASQPVIPSGLDRAIALFKKGSYQEALAEFELLLTSGVNREDAYLGKVECLRALSIRSLERFETAKQVLDEALTAFPNNAKLVSQEPWIYLDWGKHEKAAELFDSVRARLRRADLEIEQWTYEGQLQCYRYLGLYEKAAELASEARRAFPKSIRILNETGWLLVEKYCWSEAHAIFMESLEAAENVVAREGVCQCLRKLRRFDEAEDFIAESLKRYPDSARLFLEDGWLAIDQRLYERARVDFETVLKLDQANDVAREGKLQSLRGLRRFREAEDFARALLKDGNPHRRIRNELGWILCDEDRFEQALAEFKANDDAQDEIAWQGRAACLRHLRRYSEASAEIEKGLKVIRDSLRLLNEAGWLSADQHEYDQALQYFERALALEDRDEAAFHGKIACLRSMRRFDEAARAIETALSKVSVSTYVQNESAWLYFDQRDYQKALSAFEKTLDRDPHNKDAWQGKLWCLRLRRNLAEAQFQLDRLDRQGTFRHAAAIVSERAWLLLEQRRFDEARQTFDGCLRIDPHYEPALVGRIRVLRIQGKCEDAVQFARTLNEALANGPSLLYELALVHFEQKDYDGAEAKMREAMAKLPASLPLKFGWIQLLIRRGAAHQARQELELLKRDNPKDAEVFEHSAWLHVCRNSLFDAKREFEAVLDLNPDSVPGWVGLGAVHLALGRYEGAESIFRNLLDLDPDYQTLSANLALTLAARKKTNEAERLCQLTLSRDPVNARALACMGFVAFHRGHYQDSEDYFRRAIEVSRGEEGRVELAALYTHLGRYDRAEEILTEVCSERPDHARAHVEYGQLLLRTDKRQEALKHLHHARALAPRSEVPARALALALLGSDEVEKCEALLRDAIRNTDGENVWRLHLALAQVLIRTGEKQVDREYFEEARRVMSDAMCHPACAGQERAEALFQAGYLRIRLHEYEDAKRYFDQCLELNKHHYLAERYGRILEPLLHTQALAARRFAKVYGIGSSILTLCAIGACVYLKFMNRIGDATVAALIPALFALGLIGPLLPYAIKLKLPGVEAELSKPADEIAPTGPTIQPTLMLSAEAGLAHTLPTITSGAGGSL
jgi:tetratricopeptide (TPR) repeat protein